MKRIGLFLFFCILSLHGIAQVENDKDTLIIRQDKINEFINEMNEADKSMDFEVGKEIILINQDTFLSGFKAESMPHFQQEVLQVVKNGLLQVVFCY